MCTAAERVAARVVDSLSSEIALPQVYAGPARIMA